MADYVITAANFIPSANASLVVYTAGATLVRGQSVYLDPATSTVKLYKANGAAPQNVFLGLVCQDVAAGQKVLICTKDPALALGATIANGAIAIGSGNVAGAIAPSTDVVAGWFLTVLGPAAGSNTINFNPIVAGVAT